MKIDDAIIDKVLNNKASAEDAKAVSEWLATEEGHDYLSKRIDREVSSLTENEVEDWVPHVIPEEKMQQRFLQQITLRRRVNSYRRWWAAAVLIPFIFLCGSVWFLADKVGLFSETEYAELVVPCGEQMRVVLQDGTIVQLNSDTRLKYPKNFEVAKEKNRPFVVDLGDINVKVTGTKFNVKAYTAESNLWVTLDEGGVLLKDVRGKEYPLLPGESAEYNRRSGACQISRPENMEQISSWRSKGLNFYLTPLKEIVKVLERQYDVHFIIPDSALLDNRFTLSTNKVNVIDVLNDLEAVSHISFDETEEGVFRITEKE